MVIAWAGQTHCVTPWRDHGMTEVKLIHATRPCGNDIERKMSGTIGINIRSQQRLYHPCLILACAEAILAIGIRYGEQET
ncbi:hypothetical protein RRIM16_04195 [Rickettsia conorii subsp. raoultii]|nr:hypothetical protein RRIM16_04195 [Rickettsia conorii subsp. raoultii]